MKCDVCGYSDNPDAITRVVHVCNDGVVRCKMCRNLMMFGNKFIPDGEAFELWKAGNFDDRYDIDVDVLSGRKRQP